MNRLMTMLRFPLLSLCLFLSTHLATQTVITVTPSDTDFNITDPNNRHHIYRNTTVTQKDKLFLFLPGSNAVPFNYRKILGSAADLGYHVIGLTYPNEIPMAVLCQTSIDTSCHSNGRLEIFDGIDRHTGIEVDESNSIQNRLIKLLIYLHNQYPQDNWNQFIDGDSIVWNKIAIGGHSQGGGHAAIISKIKEVDRALLFATVDWLPALNRFPDWLDWQSETPAERYVGFIHELDEEVGFAIQKLYWAKLGMWGNRQVVLADTSQAPYGYTQTLSTQITPANNPTSYHGCVAVDFFTPSENSTPILEPIWHYLLEEQLPTSTEVDVLLDVIDINILPNPCNDWFIIEGAIDHYMIELYDSNSQLVANYAGTEGRLIINTSDIPPGLYIIKIKSLIHQRLYVEKIIKQ